jgi:predicted RNA binding protein YcfA (HicA-like mRNA interferase family)
MVDYYRDLIALLSANGCTYLREGKGSHEVWYSPISRQNVIVPRTTKSRHTVNKILKQAGLKKAF